MYQLNQMVMKRFNNSEVCHVWANQDINEIKEGQGNNIFFYGKSIYSYGHHFEMARLMGNNIALFNKRGYSNTTAKHQRHVLNSISHFTYFSVTSFFSVSDKSAHKNKAHKENIEAWINGAKILIEKSDRAIKHRDYYIRLYIETIEKIKQYIKIFNVPKSCFSTWINLIYNTDIEALSATLKEAKRKETEAQKRKTATLINKWRKGGNTLPRLQYDLLRMHYDCDNIETSQGVKVPINEGRQLFKLIQAVIKSGSEWKQNGQTFKIGYYQVSRITVRGDLIAGCHKILYSEIKRFAKSQKWM